MVVQTSSSLPFQEASELNAHGNLHDLFGSQVGRHLEKLKIPHLGYQDFALVERVGQAEI